MNNACESGSFTDYNDTIDSPVILNAGQRRYCPTFTDDNRIHMADHYQRFTRFFTFQTGKQISPSLGNLIHTDFRPAS